MRFYVVVSLRALLLLVVDDDRDESPFLGVTVDFQPLALPRVLEGFRFCLIGRNSITFRVPNNHHTTGYLTGSEPYDYEYEIEPCARGFYYKKSILVKLTLHLQNILR